jgi:hypothetical protein
MSTDPGGGNFCPNLTFDEEEIDDEECGDEGGVYDLENCTCNMDGGDNGGGDNGDGGGGGGGAPQSDNTPIITGIDPSVWPSNASTPDTTQVTITGQYFGTNPPSLTLSDPTLGFGLVNYSDSQIVFNVTVPASTPNEGVNLSVTNNGYGGSAFYSGSGGASPASAPANAAVLAPVNSPEVTVVAWINGQAPDILSTISAGPSTPGLESNLTGGAASCLSQLAEWFFQDTTNLNTAQDVAYANAWMFQNAANTVPPLALATPASTSQLTGGFKLFNDFGGNEGGNTAQIGSSPYPCPGPSPQWFSITGQPDQYNGYSGTSPSSGMVYQINEGAMALPAQFIFATINQHSAPWIWSAIEFDSSGNPFNINQPFPTYYVYIDGTIRAFH